MDFRGVNSTVIIILVILLIIIIIIAKALEHTDIQMDPNFSYRQLTMNTRFKVSVYL